MIKRYIIEKYKREVNKTDEFGRMTDMDERHYKKYFRQGEKENRVLKRLLKSKIDIPYDIQKLILLREKYAIATVKKLSPILIYETIILEDYDSLLKLSFHAVSFSSENLFFLNAIFSFLIRNENNIKIRSYNLPSKINISFIQYLNEELLFYCCDELIGGFLKRYDIDKIALSKSFKKRIMQYTLKSKL